MSAAGKNRLISAVIRWNAERPWLTIFVVALLCGWGLYAIRNAALDAIPDLSDTQVIILTEWAGRSPDLVEDQITYPISAALVSAPKVASVRGQSFFGVSFVYVIFEEGTDLYWARSRVMEYLSSASSRLPAGVEPAIGPDASGVGWVYQYALRDRTGNYDLQQLRALQDWDIRYALQSVPGVAEVASLGGHVGQYQVNLDPNRLVSFGVTLEQVLAAVRASNQEVGGRLLEIAGHEHMIRGRGYIESLRDLESIPVRTVGGTPVLVRDLGFVTFGPDIRRGIAELNGEGEVVGGIVVMRYGENALRTIRAVEEKIAGVRQSLPEGVELIVTYDRSELILASIATLRKSLIEEMLIVALVIFIFLMHARSAIVPILTLPVGVVLAFIPIYYQGLTVNIMSLGGIAVAIGAMVDASIVMIENIHKRIESEPDESRFESIVRGMQEVGPSIFFSLLIITASFIPVFTLTGQEGRLFRPLAYTKTWSMGFAAMLAVTLTPALAVLLIRGRLRPEGESGLNRLLIRSYEPVVRFVIRHRIVVIIVAIVLMIGTVPAYMRLGTEFMPPLYEGSILYMPTAPPGMSVGEAAEVLQRMDRELKKFPEVKSVFGKMGRADTATDPAPIGMAETTIVLHPREEWREGLTWEGLIDEMDAALVFPGMPNIWWMPVQTRTEMLSTGVRAPIGIRVEANDLGTIENVALDIEGALSGEEGVRSVFAERSRGGFFIDVVTRREEAARYGLTVSDINRVVMNGIGGENISETVEGRRRFPISVRYAREFRDDPSLLGQLLVATPGGAQIPLGQVADIRSVTGPPMIRSEDGRLVGYVFVDTDRAIADVVENLREVVAREVQLPDGARIAWVGQFQYLERARQRLILIVPLTLLIVAILLYASTRSVVETFIVLLAVPFSLIGAVWLMYALDYNISVASWVGLIALAGLDAEMGVIMLLYLTLAWRKHKDEGKLRSFQDLEEAIVDGAARRVRPKLMTVLTTILALLPIMWSTGVGAEVTKRIAAPMIGGLVTSFVLELTVYPAIFAVWKGRGMKKGYEDVRI